MFQTHEYYMSQAMKIAQQSIDEGSHPFGVVVVDEYGEIIHMDHDRVDEYIDPTAHAEVNAIRFLCKKIGKKTLEKTTFYTTSEPCVTCLSACIKARVPRLYFGCPVEPTASLPIPAIDIVKYATKYPIQVIGGILEHECMCQRDDFYQNHVS